MAEGFLVEPSSETLAWLDELNAEWDALPEPEKAAIDEELRHLQLDPPLSEIIIKTRQGWYPDEAEVVE